MPLPYSLNALRTSVCAIFFVLLFLLAGQLYAQPQADPIRTVKNISHLTKPLVNKRGGLMKNRQFEAIAQIEDSLSLAIAGQEVTASYLVDRNGGVWNLGVMELPFIIYTFTNNWKNFTPHIEAINAIAEEFADEIVTFILLPPPTDPQAIALLDDFNDRVVILFDDYFRSIYQSPEESRLLGLIAFYPTTYFLTAERRIVGIQHSNYAYIHPRKRR